MAAHLAKAGLSVKASFKPTRDGWELPVTPVIQAVGPIAEEHSELADDARSMAAGLEAAPDAVGKYWNRLLWVATK